MSADSMRPPEGDASVFAGGASTRRGARPRWTSLSAADAALLGRITVVLAVVITLAAALDRLGLMYSHKFYDTTGRAEWIWPQGELSRERPVAFFATRNFDLPASRYYTRIKIIADPEYTLYFNGREIGGRRFGESHDLDVYDVTQLARDRANRIVVAVRSVTGVGGLLATVDISPETTNYIVTGSSWSIVTEWSPALLEADRGRRSAPRLIGEPPIGRWNFLEPRDAAVTQPPASALEAREPCGFFAKLPPAVRNAARFSVAGRGCGFSTEVPEVREVSGVAIASRRAVRARAFDFGPTAGRLRVVRTGDLSAPAVFDIRYGNTPEEMVQLEGGSMPFVFAANEAVLSDPEVRHFRFVRVVKRTTPSRPPQDMSFTARLVHAITGSGLRKEKAPAAEPVTPGEVAVSAEVMK